MSETESTSDQEYDSESISDLEESQEETCWKETNDIIYVGMVYNDIELIEDEKLKDISNKYGNSLCKLYKKIQEIESKSFNEIEKKKLKIYREIPNKVNKYMIRLKKSRDNKNVKQEENIIKIMDNLFEELYELPNLNLEYINERIEDFEASEKIFLEKNKNSISINRKQKILDKISKIKNTYDSIKDLYTKLNKIYSNNMKNFIKTPQFINMLHIMNYKLNKIKSLVPSIDDLPLFINTTNKKRNSTKSNAQSDNPLIPIYSPEHKNFILREFTEILGNEKPDIINFHTSSNRRRCFTDRRALIHTLINVIDKAQNKFIIYSNRIEIMIKCPIPNCKSYFYLKDLPNKRFINDLEEDAKIMKEFYNKLYDAKIKYICKNYGRNSVYFCPVIGCVNNTREIIDFTRLNNLDNNPLLMKDFNWSKKHCQECSWSECSVCGESPYHTVYNPCSGIRKTDKWIREFFPDFDELTPEEQIEKLSKFRVCPNCKYPYQKNDGCNHVKCLKCDIDFCFGCRMVLDKVDPYRHNCPLRNIDQNSNVFHDTEEAELNGW